MFLIEDIENETAFLRVWLKRDRIGYTTDIDKAGRFTLSEAVTMEHFGRTKMWSEAVVLNQSKRVIVK